MISSGPPVSSTNKADCHDITEILLKVALNTINPKSKSKCVGHVSLIINEIINHVL